MKEALILILILIFGISAFAQSGRRRHPATVSVPEAKPSPSPTPSLPERSQVTAEKDEDYRCTNDGTLARLLDKDDVVAFSAKEVDTKAEITAKPNPMYTREARRVGAQGLVTLKVLLSADGTLDRVRVVKGLPYGYGLTENAIRAACQIKFKPAIKDGKPVSQWATVEYAFRLANSSIFGP